MNVGIAVTTTPNREKVFEKFYESYAKYAPNVPLYLHNDRNYRGIVYSKNKCLEALEGVGVTDLFLFDDDLIINSPDFIEHYISAGLNHACWNYNKKVIGGQANYLEYDKPNGCMIYLRKICLDTVGGFDPAFKGYAYEHVSFSDRIFNAGLTPARYIDIPKSSGLFSMQRCGSSVSREIRAASIPANKKLYEANFNSKQFIPYK